jgi:hypothetical protein
MKRSAKVLNWLRIGEGDGAKFAAGQVLVRMDARLSDADGKMKLA